jgi:hypothetical protein
MVRHDMEHRENDDRNKIGVERHVQTIVTSITLALLMWTGMTLVDSRDRLARLEEKLISLAVNVQDGKLDKFSESDWKREKEIIDERFRRLERDIELKHREEPYGKSRVDRP